MNIIIHLKAQKVDLTWHRPFKIDFGEECAILQNLKMCACMKTSTFIICAECVFMLSFSHSPEVIWSCAYWNMHAFTGSFGQPIRNLVAKTPEKKSQDFSTTIRCDLFNSDPHAHCGYWGRWSRLCSCTNRHILSCGDQCVSRAASIVTKSQLALSRTSSFVTQSDL